MADMRKENIIGLHVDSSKSNIIQSDAEDDILSDMDIDFDDDENSANITSNELISDDLGLAEEDVADAELEIDFGASSSEEPQDIEDETHKSEEKEEKEAVSKHSKRKKSKKEEDDKPINLILYIVADKAHVGMVSYCRNYGANVSRVFTNITEARDSLLMQVEPFRVIVIDSGTGRFTNMGARKELIDLLGICDVDTRITVFYTDSAIKTDVELSDEVEDKKINWYKYRSTPDIVAHILQNSEKENYILDANSNDNIVVDESILNIKGLSVKEEKKIDLGKPSITPDDIIFNMVNNKSTEGELPKYDIKIRA